MLCAGFVIRARYYIRHEWQGIFITACIEYWIQKIGGIPTVERGLVIRKRNDQCWPECAEAWKLLLGMRRPDYHFSVLIIASFSFSFISHVPPLSHGHPNRSSIDLQEPSISRTPLPTNAWFTWTTSYPGYCICSGPSIIKPFSPKMKWNEIFD